MSYSDSPWAWDTTDDDSAFEPSQWMALRSEIEGRPPPVLPKPAILTVDSAQLDQWAQGANLSPDDFTGADHPFVTSDHRDLRLTVMRTAKGSYATGALEELIALGARAVVFLGGTGAISQTVEPGDIVVASAALRDEGVSLHYAAPERFSYPDRDLADLLAESAANIDASVHVAPVWTTGAHFRETKSRIAQFSSEGCISVDNESASLFAAGAHRRVAVASLLHVGDSIASGTFVPGTGEEPSTDMLDAAIDALSRWMKETG